MGSVDKVYDLSKTRDSSLIGAIGEMLAWKYLRRKRIWAYKIGGWYPFPATYPFESGGSRYELRGLTEEQINYLKKMCLHESRRFDFVGIKRKRWSWAERNYKVVPYLIEVKTTGLVGERKDLYGRMSGKIPEDIEEAKANGFKILLVIVKLLENWKYTITCQEL